MALLDRPILSTPFFYYLVFLGIGLRLAPIGLRWSPEVVLGLIIGGSAITAIVVSPVVGRNAPATAFLASLTLLLIPMMFVRNVEKIFYAMIPLCYIQAIWMAWQWFTQPLGVRATGLALNANAGSSLLLIGAVFLATHPRLKWLAVPLLVAIPFSGSRWVLIVGMLVFGLLFISRIVPWRYTLIGVTISATLLFATQHEQLRAVYRATRSPVGTVESGEAHAKYRLTPPVPLTTLSVFIPKGFIDSNLHNVPLRMTVETGLISGAAWLAMGVLVLYRRPRYGYSWWMMLTICLLSIMYYHTWVGPMGAFWWLLAGKLTDNTSDPPNKGLRLF